MKLLIRIFLSLSFLLLAGYSTIQANPQRHLTTYSSLITFATSQGAGFNIVLNNPALITLQSPSLADTNREKIFAEETEDKSQESVSVRKHKGDATANYFTTFYDYTSRYFSHYIKKCLPYCEHFSYWSSFRYIALRVFRI